LRTTTASAGGLTAVSLSDKGELRPWVRVRRNARKWVGWSDLRQVRTVAWRNEKAGLQTRFFYGQLSGFVAGCS